MGEQMSERDIEALAAVVHKTTCGIPGVCTLPYGTSDLTIARDALAWFAEQDNDSTTPPWLIDSLTQYAQDMLTIQDANVQLIGQAILFAINTAKRTVTQPAQPRETPGQAETIEAAGRAIDVWSKDRLDFVLGTSERNELAAAVLDAAGPYIEAQTLISTADLASKALGDWGETVRSWLLTLSQIKRRA